jgi:hypothetical protein
MKYIEFKKEYYTMGNEKRAVWEGYAANEIRAACGVASDNIDARCSTPCISIWSVEAKNAREMDDELNVFMRPVALPASLAVRTCSRLSSSRRGSYLRP